MSFLYHREIRYTKASGAFLNKSEGNLTTEIRQYRGKHYLHVQFYFYTPVFIGSVR